MVQILFYNKSNKENPTLNLPKSYLKLISSKCSSFWLTTYLLCLVGVLFNRLSEFLWVSTVLLFSQSCCFIRRDILHTAASQEKQTEASPIIKFHVPLYRWCPFTKYFYIWWLCWSHLSHDLDIKDITDTVLIYHMTLT
jgi:hypothetical protein